MDQLKNDGVVMKIKKMLNLHNIGWLCFFMFLVLNAISLFQDFQDKMIYRTLPFYIKYGQAVSITDSTLASQLKNVQIIKINNLEIDPELTEINDEEEEDDATSNFRLILGGEIVLGGDDSFTAAIREATSSKAEVQVSFQQDNKIRNIFVKTKIQIDRGRLSGIVVNIFFLLFVFFNSFLLLKYSISQENILIVFFLLFLSGPTNLDIQFFSAGLEYISGAMAGPLFYHFMLKKIGSSKKPKLIHYFSIIIAFASLALATMVKEFALLPYFWSVIWVFVAFIVLWKAYKSTSAIQLKRLINSFSGVFIAIIASLVIALSGFMLSWQLQNHAELNIYDLQVAVFLTLLIVSLLAFFLGILWFFGAFTWSMLTGTALGVKIRSTMIFSIVGVVFVTVFGFIDYTLGEILQTIFGRFMGSEFIAGIPATIGLLLFFNPVRHKVESVVDKKLNTSDLNFLESTHTFTETLADEGVIEGFEEYICENLIARLPITKVALISYDAEMHDFKFNEIRGSEVIENSAVDDIEGLLVEDKIHRISSPIERIQDCSSFALIIPIIYDNTDRWFIAFGEKKDRSNYSKRDESSLIKLTDRIRLSLKFILAYEGMMNRKFQLQLQEKEEEISNLRLKLEESCS